MNILITGGIGFIGINTVLRFSKSSENNITIFDSLDKLGTLKYLNGIIPSKAKFIKGDLRNSNDVKTAFTEVPYEYDIVIHLAGQTAVTTSIKNPIKDFECNALGTFNLLESVRKYSPNAKFIYASTNKVYGELKDKTVFEEDTRYIFEFGIDSISEDEPLNFHSPYGASKGCADQYVRDYHRIYGLNTNVVRQSCIYGTYQDGTEDQGWVAWFVKAFLNNIPLILYGDGKQVRDILYIDDLIDFYEVLIHKAPGGEIYNIGGGPTNSISLLELIDKLKKLTGKPVDVSYKAMRAGDQKIFISDNSKATSLEWTPKISVDNGLQKLYAFLEENK